GTTFAPGKCAEKELFQQKWAPLLRPEQTIVWEMRRERAFPEKVGTTFAPGTDDCLGNALG
ncbi:MAG: hypothetical protein ACC634_01360, partial [Hyphomicrobiales bacterium]